MTMERWIGRAVVTLTVLAMAACLAFIPGRRGGWAFIAALAGLIVYCLAQAALNLWHSRTLRRAAGLLGWSYLPTAAAEAKEPLFTALGRGLDPDNFRQRLGGGYPAVIGRSRGFTALVRLPRAYAPEYGPEAEGALHAHLASPEGTRISVWLPGNLRAFTVVPRASLRAQARGRKTETGDEAFDRTFVVLGGQPGEVRAVLTPSVRRALLDTRPFRSLGVDRYGVTLHEAGKSFRAQALILRLELAVELAERVRELETGT